MTYIIYNGFYGSVESVHNSLEGAKKKLKKLLKSAVPEDKINYLVITTPKLLSINQGISLKEVNNEL